jgi:hypothetical protein
MPDFRATSQNLLRALKGLPARVRSVKLPQVRGRGLVRGVIIGLGLVVLVAVSVLAGRFTGQEQPAAAEPAEADTPAAEGQEALPDIGEHEHGQDDRNPYLVVPEDIEPWSDSATYTDPDGNAFTIHVELEAPSTDGMGMCSVGPSATKFNRTVVLSIRNDGEATATGPKLYVDARRIAFPHADGLGCSTSYPSDVDGEYEPGSAKTFRGLLVTEPADQDVVLVLGSEKEELLRIPATAFADAA